MRRTKMQHFADTYNYPLVPAGSRDYNREPTSLLVQSSSSVGRSRGADRAGIKGRWLNLLEVANLQLARATSGNGTSRPHLSELVDLLDQAAALPVPDQSPGGAKNPSSLRGLCL